MEPTADDFRALARSSPWRWRTLHFRYRHSDLPAAEAWVRRPGELVVVDATGERWSRHEVTASAHPDDADLVFGADGLVAQRPEVPYGTDYDPMWGNYSWVAMLDPVELSHHVDVAGAPRRGVRTTSMAGRGAGARGLRPTLRRQLLRAHLERGGPHVRLRDPRRGAARVAGSDLPRPLRRGPRRRHRCRRPLPSRRRRGEGDPAPWIEVDILEVDADLAGMF